MKILVLSKEVPDTAATRSLDPETGVLLRSASEPVPDEINERTIEHALRYREAGNEVEIVVLAVVPETGEASIRKFLAMGADSAVIVADPAIGGADAVRTAQIIAQAVSHIQPDLVLAGNESTDGRSGVVPAMVAEFLDWPALPSLGEVQITEGRVSGTTSSEGETLELAATLPAIVSVTERSAEPRFPNFKGIMQAKKKPMTFWTLADLGADQGLAASSVLVSAAERPARTAGITVTDDGTGVAQLVDFLAANRLL